MQTPRARTAKDAPPGVSLHKWACAPIGTGFLYVRKSRIASTWPLMAAEARQDNDIRKFEEIGTHPAGYHNAISHALAFSESIGIDRKVARLRYLRDRWAQRLAENPKVKILHSPDPAMSAGIGFLRMRVPEAWEPVSTAVQLRASPRLALTRILIL